MKSIAKWTLWQRRWNTAWWALGIFVLLAFTLVFYPTFRDQAAELQKSFDSLPDAALQLFGGSADFFSPVGFLNSQIYFMVMPLLLGVLAIGMGTNLLAREEQDTTIETLLARPVSRSSFLAAKAAAGTMILAAISLVGFATTAIMAKFIDLTIPTSYIAEVSFACFVLCLSFGAIAFFITTLGRARSASIGITSAIAVGGYLVSSLAGTVDWLKGPAKVFPFHYYQSEAILRGHFDWSDMLLLLILVVVCGVLSWVSFRRRDIG